MILEALFFTLKVQINQSAAFAGRRIRSSLVQNAYVSNTAAKNARIKTGRS